MEDSYVLQMKNPLFLDLSLWFWGMSECKPGHSIGPEVRPNYIIHCVLDGKVLGVSPTMYRKTHIKNVEQINPGKENPEIIEKMLRV